MADLAQRPSAAVRSLGELALNVADRYSGDAMRAPGRATLTYDDFGRAVREIAGGLASLGVATGDKVGILCGTIPEWTLADFGALCAGATVVPVYHTNSPEECGRRRSSSRTRRRQRRSRRCAATWRSSST
jgi:long-chain acyl-CoA synthetase